MDLAFCEGYCGFSAERKIFAANGILEIFVADIIYV